MDWAYRTVDWAYRTVDWAYRTVALGCGWGWSAKRQLCWLQPPYFTIPWEEEEEDWKVQWLTLAGAGGAVGSGKPAGVRRSGSPPTTAR